MASKSFEIVVLCGAISPEREVSIRSGHNVARLLSRHYPIRLIELNENKLPPGLDPEPALIFPLIHGDFGEDGQLQRLLDGGGFTYVGTGVEGMELTIDKSRAKKRVQNCSIPVLPEIAFAGGELGDFTFASACERLGCPKLFLKPRDRGSSIGCHRICNEDDWARHVLTVGSGLWLLEPLCAGKDLTIGMLQGEPLAILEITPAHEFFDYESKYTPDGARHICPAPLEDALTRMIGNYAREIFRACHCRDWCRIDFLMDDTGKIYFLEVNTIPGFTEGSLYPEGALGAGMAPDEVLCQIIAPALCRLLS
jgi:D-alanine-D-alanine ligase